MNVVLRVVTLGCPRREEPRLFKQIPPGNSANLIGYRSFLNNVEVVTTMTVNNTRIYIVHADKYIEDLQEERENYRESDPVG